jgi:hypothetical protein
MIQRAAEAGLQQAGRLYKRAVDVLRQALEAIVQVYRELRIPYSNHAGEAVKRAR